MRVRDIMPENGGVFVRSEYNRIGSGWPCFACTKPSHIRMMMSGYQKGSDVIFAIGTTNPDRTKNRDHRSKLLTVYTIEPKLHCATKDIVPAESWDHHVRLRSASIWANALPALRIWQLPGPPYPDAHDYCPDTYAGMGDVTTRGRAVKVIDPDERKALMQLVIDYEDSFPLAPRVSDFTRNEGKQP